MIRRIRCVLAVATALSGSSAGLGLGLGIKPIWLAASLIGLILLVMFIGDHPRVLPAHWHQTVILDRALAEDGELHVRLEEVMDGKVHRWRPLRLQPRSPECGSRAADHRNDPGLPHRRPAHTGYPLYDGGSTVHRGGLSGEHPHNALSPTARF